MILLISASWVARFIHMNHQFPAGIGYFFSSIEQQLAWNRLYKPKSLSHEPHRTYLSCWDQRGTFHFLVLPFVRNAEHFWLIKIDPCYFLQTHT
jgi:hypothetical protein